MSALALLLVGLLGAPPTPTPWSGTASVEPQFLPGPDGKLEPSSVRRIVSLAPSVTEILFELGVGDRVVGVTRYDDFPELVRGLPKVGGFIDPNAERILRLRPDLVVAVPNAQNRPVLERLSSLGLRVLVVPGNRLPDVWHATRALGRALGPRVEERGRELLARLEHDIRRVQGLVGKQKGPQVAFVYGRAPLILAGPGSFADSMLRALGASNIVRIEQEYPSYSLEQLLVDAPEVIIDVSMEHGGASGFWSDLTNLPAVRSGRVHAMSGTSFLRAGPRIVDALERLRPLLYPKDQGTRSSSK